MQDQHQTAWIAASAVVDSSVRLDRWVNIQGGVKIGPWTHVEEYVFIREGANIGFLCTIGRGSVIDPGVIIPPETCILPFSHIKESLA